MSANNPIQTPTATKLHKETVIVKLWTLIDLIAYHNPELKGSDISFTCHTESFKLNLSPNVCLTGISHTEFSVRITDEKTVIAYFHRGS